MGTSGKVNTSLQNRFQGKSEIQTIRDGKTGPEGPDRSRPGRANAPSPALTGRLSPRGE